MKAASRTCVVWHLGFQKTGTTTIQRTIVENAATFERHAAVFSKGPSTDAIRRAAIAYIAERSAERHAALVRAAAAIGAAAGDHPQRTALVSDENILGHDIYNRHGHFLEWAAAIIPILAEAVAPAESHFVVYTRAFEAWARSAYNQTVKACRNTATFREWRDAIPFPRDWERALALLPCDRYRITATPMEEADRLGTVLFSAFGLGDEDVASLTRVEPRNHSLSDGATTFMRAANRSELDDRSLDIVRRLVLHHEGSFR